MALITRSGIEVHSVTMASGRAVTATITAVYNEETEETTVRVTHSVPQQLTEAELAEVQTFMGGLDELSSALDTLITPA